MVKKIITVLLFLVLIGLALLQGSYIGNTSGKMSALGKKAAAFAREDDMDGAHASMKALYKEWQRQKDYYEALMEHSESDKISTALERAIGFAAHDDKVQFIAEANALIYLLEHIHEIDSLSIENLL